MTEITHYTTNEPTRAQLETDVLALRHAVLDPARVVPCDEILSDEDFLTTTIHRAAILHDSDTSRVISTVRADSVALNGLHYMMRKIATDPEYAGLGVGSEVLESAEHEAEARGARMVWADAHESAISFFEDNGYWQVGSTITHEDGVLNYRMFKKVGKR